MEVLEAGTERYRGAIDHHGLPKLGISSALKPQQTEAITSFLDGNDTKLRQFVNLQPTHRVREIPGIPYHTTVMTVPLSYVSPFCIDFIKVGLCNVRHTFFIQ